MSEPQKKDNFNPAKLSWFNLDNRYATKQDLINSNHDIKQSIKLSNTELKSQIDKVDTKLSANLNAKIAKSELSVIKWVISTGVAVIGAMAALKFF